jgi:hypothetical protein
MRFAWWQQYGIDKNAAISWLQSPANSSSYCEKDHANVHDLLEILLYFKTLGMWVHSSLLGDY